MTMEPLKIGRLAALLVATSGAALPGCSPGSLNEPEFDPGMGAGAGGGAGMGGSTGTGTGTGTGAGTGTGTGTGAGTGTGTGTQPPTTSELPCEVALLLGKYCTGCHSSPPARSVPIALVSYDDVTKPSRRDPARTTASLCLARLRDGSCLLYTSPSPRDS